LDREARKVYQETFTFFAVKGIFMNGQVRSDIKPGIIVLIVLKQDQPTGKLTKGVVKDILTKSPNHPHGIKVRLADGQVGRVKEIVDTAGVG
jgi:uncharacterized repeat protein (TIGR03833 family)